jgi:histidine triad (HIT) family protein
MMSTIFSRIIRGDAPAHIVWEDDLVVAFLDNHPQTPGHVLIVPRSETDRWTDLSLDEHDRMFRAAREIGRAQLREYRCERIGLVIAGYHVPHAHIHVFPTGDISAFDFSRLPPAKSVEELATEAARMRNALRRAGMGRPGIDERSFLERKGAVTP